MKKVLAIFLMIMLVACMCVTAFAAPNKFVSSPSGNSAPVIVGFRPHNEECTADLVITSYADRLTLSETLLDLIEKAYGEIVASDDLTELNSDLAKVANDKGIDGELLAVSDLFDIHVVGCDFHNGHYGFDLTLSADTLDRFVGLLHMDINGEWELIDNAEVVKDGEHLRFTVDSLTPFAIVVDTTEEDGDQPQTGDNNRIIIALVCMLISAIALVVVLTKIKKQKNNA